MFFGFIPDLSKNPKYGYGPGLKRYPYWYRQYFATKSRRVMTVIALLLWIFAFLFNPYTYVFGEIAVVWVFAIVVGVIFSQLLFMAAYWVCFMITLPTLYYFLAFGAGARLLQNKAFMLMLGIFAFFQSLCKIFLFFGRNFKILTNIVCFIPIFIFVMNDIYYNYGLYTFTHDAYAQYSNHIDYLANLLAAYIN